MFDKLDTNYVFVVIYKVSKKTILCSIKIKSETTAKLFSANNFISSGFIRPNIFNIIVFP